MSTFLARLGERAIGAGATVMPLVTPLFGSAAPRATRAVPPQRPAPGDENAGFLEEPVHGQGSSVGTPPTRASDPVESRLPEREASHTTGGRADATDPLEDRSRGAISRRALPAARMTSQESLAGPALNPAREAEPPVPDARGTERESRDAADRGTRDALVRSDRRSVGDGWVESANRDARHGPDRAAPPPSDDFERDKTRPARHAAADASPMDAADVERLWRRLRALGHTTPSAGREADRPLAPVVRVSIGRIDVRATPAPVAAPTGPGAAPPLGPTLAEFLAKRSKS